MEKRAMDINHLKNEIEKFSLDRDWDKFHSLKNLSMALSVETSELLEIFQWLTEEESNQIIHNPVLLNQVEEEMADILIYLLRISFKTKSNLEEIILNKLLKSAEKYPIKLSKGNSKKYTDL
jgi:NTP pyrophosphatase (non-canonical NTP hydrolase)